MSYPLLALNIVVWLLVLAYSLRLIPRRERLWKPWLIPFALVAAAGLSFFSYQLAQKEQARKRFEQHYVTGLGLKQQGNFAEAEQEFERARALRPGSPEVEQQLKELKERKTADRRESTKDTRIAAAPEGSPAGPPARTPPDDRNTPGRKPKPLRHKNSPFEIVHYGMDLHLYPAEHQLKARADIRVRSRGETVPVLDFSLNPEFKPVLVQVDGAPAKWEHRKDLLAVTAPRPLAPGREVVVTVRYGRKGPAILGDTLDLLSARACYLRSETRWYPATGELDFRAPVRMKVTVPAGYTAVSLGELKSKTREGARVAYHWESDRPASMVSVAAAKYVRQALPAPLPAAARSPGRGPLEISCYTFPEHKDRAPSFMKEAASIIRFYESKFGPYPYEKLAIAEIPLFPGGYGTTSFIMLIDASFAARKLDREFVAHEIAHQWWGNSVFPQGYGAAWLSEAFANYSAFLYDAAAAGNPRVLQKRVRKATSEFFRKTAAQGDQAIAENDPYQPVGARDAILYEKGAVILHMLRRQVGDAAFFRMLRATADRHRFGKASIDDFKAIAQKESGQDLGWFFDQWLGRPGGIRLEYSFTSEPEGLGTYRTLLTIRQPEPAYRARMKVLLDTGDRPEAHWIEISGREQQISLITRGKTSSVLFDPAGDFLMRPPRWVVEP